MHDGFAALPAAAFHGELGKKMQVTKESLQKVETGSQIIGNVTCDLFVVLYSTLTAVFFFLVCFNVKVRGSEYPEEMLAQMELSGFQGDDE